MIFDPSYGRYRYGVQSSRPALRRASSSSADPRNPEQYHFAAGDNWSETPQFHCRFLSHASWRSAPSHRSSRQAAGGYRHDQDLHQDRDIHQGLFPGHEEWADSPETSPSYSDRQIPWSSGIRQACAPAECACADGHNHILKTQPCASQQAPHPPGLVPTSDPQQYATQPCRHRPRQRLEEDQHLRPWRQRQCHAWHRLRRADQKCQRHLYRLFMEHVLFTHPVIAKVITVV